MARLQDEMFSRSSLELNRHNTTFVRSWCEDGAHYGLHVDGLGRLEAIVLEQRGKNEVELHARQAFADAGTLAETATRCFRHIVQRATRVT